MESQGALRDVWNALRRLSETHNDVINGVESCNALGEFSAHPEPKIIGFDKFNDAEIKAKAFKEINWPLLSIGTETPRGLLVARVKTSHGDIYFLEIQRRTRVVATETGDFSNWEQAFRGLVFTLDHPASLNQWLNCVLDKIRFTNGVLSKVTGECPGRAVTFKHSSAQNEMYPQETAIRRAFALMDVHLPKPPKAVETTNVAG